MKTGPLGTLLEECGRAIGAGDRDAFEAKTAALAKSLVAGGFGADGALVADRIDSTTRSLRITLTSARLNPEDRRMKSAIDSLALVCSNVDERIAKEGPLPEPVDAPPKRRRRKAKP